jgi:hypothetical protein
VENKKSRSGKAQNDFIVSNNKNTLLFYIFLKSMEVFSRGKFDFFSLSARTKVEKKQIDTKSSARYSFNIT